MARSKILHDPVKTTLYMERALVTDAKRLAKETGFSSLSQFITSLLLRESRGGNRKLLLEVPEGVYEALRAKSEALHGNLNELVVFACQTYLNPPKK